jgi:hypothetical protein
MTLEAARASNAPQPFFQQIEATLASIASARAPLQAQSSNILYLQGPLVRHLTVCENALGQIANAQESLIRDTFLRVSPPIWNSLQWEKTKNALPAHSREVVNAFLAEVGQYSAESPEWILIVVAFFGGILPLSFFARQRVHTWETADRVRKPFFEVFEHPYCASLSVMLLALTGPFSQMPMLSKALLQTLSIVPMILLVRSSLDRRLIPGLWALGALFAVDTARQGFSGVTSLGQAILVFESFLAMTVIALIILREDHSWSSMIKVSVVRVDTPWLLAKILLPYFAVCLVAGATGYTNLARLLTPSILVGGYLGLALYASFRVISGIMAFSLHVWPLKRLLVLQNSPGLLEKRLYPVLIWCAIFGWVLRFLDYMGFLEPSIAIVKKILGAKFEHGTIAISLGDVCAFIITVWIAYSVVGIPALRIERRGISAVPGCNGTLLCRIKSAPLLYHRAWLHCRYRVDGGQPNQGDRACGSTRRRYRLRVAECGEQFRLRPYSPF